MSVSRQTRIAFYCSLAAAPTFAQQTALTARIETGQQLESQGEFQQAEQIFSEALREAEKQGAGLRAIAAALDNLSGAECDLGRYADAERLYLRALAASRTAAGSNSEAAGRVMFHLAGMYLETGRFPDAMPLLRRFEEIAIHNAASEPIDAARDMERLGPIYIALGESAKARPILQRSVEILQEQQESGKDLELALALLKLGAACGNLGMKQEAVANIERASAMVKQLNVRQPRVLIDFWTTSGMVYAQAKREADSETALRRAEELAQSFYGADHPIYGLVLKTHAAALRTFGHNRQAKTLDQQSSSILARNGRRNALGYAIDLSEMERPVRH